MTDKDASAGSALAPLEDKPPLHPARLLRGRFQLISEIGRGGLSRVYKARDMVAVQAGLGDPNIVRVYDMDAEGRFHFMIMEYLEGHSLGRALREADGNRLSDRRIDKLVTDIASALHFAHSRGIIHADLKPGNVFIETSGRIKLIDFNIAYPVARPMKTREEDTVAILGRLGALTPVYASPQRLAGAEPGTGDDVFSLGLMVYLALTGNRPFNTRDAKLAAEAGLVPQHPEGLSNWRWRALRNAISFDDKERTSSVEKFARDFTGGPLSAVTRFFPVSWKA